MAFAHNPCFFTLTLISLGVNGLYSDFGKTKEWFDKELKLKGYKDYKNILLATIDINEKITIYEKNKCIKVSNVLE